MPTELSQFPQFLANMGMVLWNFFISNWFSFAMLLVGFIFPKLFSLFRHSIGK